MLYTYIKNQTAGKRHHSLPIPNVVAYPNIASGSRSRSTWVPSFGINIRERSLKHSLPASPAGGSLTGFTLIELLIVIVIILILATMSVVSVSALRERAKIDATKALIGKIEIALRTYKEVFLDFPPSESDTTRHGHLSGSQNLWYYLYEGSAYESEDEMSSTGYSPGLFVKVIRPPDPRTQEEGIYKKVQPPIGPEGFKGKEIDSEHYIIDLWDLRLHYKKPGENHTEGDPDSTYRWRNNNNYVDLASAGPDGEINLDDESLEINEDNITNWKEKK